MKLEVGQVYKDITGFNEIVMIESFEGLNVRSKVLFDPQDHWDGFTDCSIDTYLDYYKPFPQYNTPLYKALNS